MTDITITTTLANVPVNGLTDEPEINIRRIDTGALVVTAGEMIDRGGDGLYTFNFVPVAGLNYSFLIDADPQVTGQVDIRFFDGTFDNESTDLWNDHGLNPSIPKTVTEIAARLNYDEDVASPTSIHKDVTKTGTKTTIQRT